MAEPQHLSFGPVRDALDSIRAEGEQRGCVPETELNEYERRYADAPFARRVRNYCDDVRMWVRAAIELKRKIAAAHDRVPAGNIVDDD